MEVDESMQTDQHMTQAHQQIFRNAQASKQMVYEVFKNVIGTLEEFESRTAGKNTAKLPRSIEKKEAFALRTKNDIRGQLETQLFLFQSQLQSCDTSILEDVKGDLLDCTVKWMSSRANKKVPMNDTDRFAGKLAEILTEGLTSHPEAFKQSPGSIPNIGQEELQHVFSAQYETRELDNAFRNNPDKQAIAPEARACVDTEEGAQRLQDVNPNLTVFLSKYQDNIR
ncbi:Hypothetical predicted protein [Mytilus galloprovincialis]|uniref:Uncharacterized protein n=1 Tax=Mytilus galloprovincialis TaxID=29158 RepID=A0A8B6FFI4_MYTGA|nr:Hypothetical predicted protein [Mytilus galloprovincialis]